MDANLNAAQARLAQATTAVNLASKEEARYRNLLNVGAVSIETYDTYKSRLDDALAVQATAQAGVDSTQAALLQNEQNRAQIDSARQQAAALQSQLDSANLNLHETEIRAPFDGIITNKYVEEGSLISSSVPIYSLQDRTDNWVDFKIKETEITNFAVGEKVQPATGERGDVDIIAFNIKIRTST